MVYQYKQSKRPFIALVALVALGVSVVSIVRTSFQSGPPQYDPSLDICLGERMAEETAKLLDGRGNVVVLSAAGGKFTYAMAEAQMKGFKRGLKRFDGMLLAGVEGPADENMQGVPADFFVTVVRKYPNARAIVSFMGLPAVATGGRKTDVARLPTVVALDLSGEERWKECVRSELVDTVICWRPDINWTNLPQKGDCRTLYDARYRAVNKVGLREME